MRFALSLGVAFAALTLAASAHTDHQRTVIRHHGGGMDLNIDADEDGWVTRAEASAAADRAFDQMDGNDDGRLDSADRRALHTFDVHIDGPEVEVLEGGDDDRRVRIFRHGDGDDDIIDREVSRAVREAERAAEEAERTAERAEREAERAAEMAERHAERLEREAEREAERAEREAERAERHAERAERHIERHIVIVRGDGLKYPIDFSFDANRYFEPGDPNHAGVTVHRGLHDSTLIDYINNNPLNFFCADFSHLCCNDMRKANADGLLPFDADRIDCIDWLGSNVDIEREFWPDGTSKNVW